MNNHLEKEWNLMDEKRREYVLKRKKIRIENESNPKLYVNVVLPVNEDELNDIFGDILGRDDEGFVLDNQSVNWYYTKGNVEIENIFVENELVLQQHKMKMPSYQYGKNPDVTKENGEIYKGTINSTPRYKAKK